MLASTFTCGMFEMSDMMDVDKKIIIKNKEKKIVSLFTTGLGEGG